jgi:hypothetical protein
LLFVVFFGAILLSVFILDEVETVSSSSSSRAVFSSSLDDVVVFRLLDADVRWVGDDEDTVDEDDDSD